MNKYLHAVENGETLSEDQMMKTMDFIMEGKAFKEDLAGFLTKLAERGETVDEIVGAARALRKRAIGIHSPRGTVDCCGTGGDLSGSYNISTAVAFVAAACGVPIAKHGNRASSSRCGAADVLEILGANLNMPPEALEESLRDYNFTFLLASRHHPAMKHVAVIRKKIGKPTLFNLMGPLVNPAGAKLQLLGVYARKWMAPMTQALKKLGAERAWVVHGEGGLDEISVSGPTYAAILEDGEITEKTFAPEDFGVGVHAIDKLRGGDGKDNAAALRAVLEGQKGAYRDIVLANVSAVLNIHGSAKDLKEGTARAARVIDDGSALLIMKDYIAFSRLYVAPEQPST